MRDQRALVRCDVAIDRRERGVVRHHPFPRLALHLHAHHFIDLHGHGPLGKVIVKLANRPGAEPWLFESVRAEGGAEGHATPRALPDLEHRRPLRLQVPEVGIPVVDHADVNCAQVQALDQGIERRIILVDVNVRINGSDLREVLEQRTLVACGSLGLRSREQYMRKLHTGHDGRRRQNGHERQLRGFQRLPLIEWIALDRLNSPSLTHLRLCLPGRVRPAITWPRGRNGTRSSEQTESACGLTWLRADERVPGGPTWRDLTQPFYKM